MVTNATKQKNNRSHSVSHITFSFHVISWFVSALCLLSIVTPVQWFEETPTREHAFDQNDGFHNSHVSSARGKLGVRHTPRVPFAAKRVVVAVCPAAISHITGPCLVQKLGESRHKRRNQVGYPGELVKLGVEPRGSDSGPIANTVGTMEQLCSRTCLKATTMRVPVCFAIGQF